METKFVGSGGFFFWIVRCNLIVIKFIQVGLGKPQFMSKKNFLVVLFVIVPHRTHKKHVNFFASHIADGFIDTFQT